MNRDRRDRLRGDDAWMPAGIYPVTRYGAGMTTFYEIVKNDTLVKSPKTPSPLTGEGWGEGETRLFMSAL